MNKYQRICVNLPIDMEQELRVLHAEVIAKTRRNVSFSKFFSYLIREILSEKKKQYWYGEHDCTIIEL